MEFVTLRQREAAQPSKEFDIPGMCGHYLGRGKVCTGDETKPGTHAPSCPRRNFSRDTYYD